jgi:hypothetical protein
MLLFVTVIEGVIGLQLVPSVSKTKDQGCGFTANVDIAKFETEYSIGLIYMKYK